MEKNVLIMATNNAHKLEEVRQILQGRYQVKGLADIGCHEEVPEDADTLQGNALQKARYVHDRYGVDCFADDTGLEVEALDGAPGVHTARYATDGHDTQANMRKLLKEMSGCDNRKARFRTAIALIQNGEEHLFNGQVDGYISTEPLGNDGFGYDPVFMPEETGKTFAQLGEDYKNKISHRARAVAKLMEFLNEKGN